MYFRSVFRNFNSPSEYALRDTHRYRLRVVEMIPKHKKYVRNEIRDIIRRGIDERTKSENAGVPRPQELYVLRYFGARLLLEVLLERRMTVSDQITLTDPTRFPCRKEFQIQNWFSLLKSVVSQKTFSYQ